MSYQENQISDLIDAGLAAMDEQKKYLSYLVVTKFNQEAIKEWHTVEVVHNGLKVRNKHSVETGIGPFLRLRHFYHDEPIVDYPA